ncbi:MAG: ATP-binding cassette domain-containing protein [Candidatus Synoicihabitans palmerolidicus]|nr:ATP-binding cassette domain-containing protein [Candidatus Synoicihabitans palmerolidicus]MCC5025892.1 ATP-binding cassette domain-containing protein [Candidatus Synoicihabitans palmerolidicus]MCC5025933.1 ATP-binding cassette domain-containing protein [Candidatus Synoicihabitans palmerolidicus]MCC5025972.1 ATP-binding cassette domain-containing protein [Candidatus Synoicihabitans palmerolidicus]MCC5026016.1 ATP-binding cassette domain-containing protein [Candidatus Synoicihabitans palmeroli
MSFAYYNDKGKAVFFLDPFEFSLTSGKLLCITGGNGSGKSTFLKVLAGLYPPEAGTILLDGSPVTATNRQSYRSLFRPIFTDFHLFDTLYGFDDIDEALLTHWLHRTDLWHKTGVEERKLTERNLSRGQRKRLALVLALMEDKPILLLDEWAAEQDPQFRRIFYREILSELRAEGKTIIAVSHDDEHYDVADRTLKMHYGKFVPFA